MELASGGMGIAPFSEFLLHWVKIVNDRAFGAPG